MRILLAVAVCLLSLLANQTIVVADPPPWAPAHGYHKQKPKYKYRESRPAAGVDIYAQIPPGGYISDGRCQRESIGKAVGAVLGGALGAHVGDNEPIAIIAGAIIGFVVGGSIGRSMDERDRACVGQVLEYTSDHKTIEWHNPDTDVQYAVTPTRTYRSGDDYCREYTRSAVIGGKTETVYGKACRQQDGAWKIMN